VIVTKKSFSFLEEIDKSIGLPDLNSMEEIRAVTWSYSRRNLLEQCPLRY